jgi:hypothetical protein
MVAVVAVGMVQVAVHQVIGMVAVRHGFVTAAGTVTVTLIVSTAVMGRRAVAGIGSTHRQHVLVHMVALNVVQVPVMQVVCMAVVLDGGMAAAGAVLVAVVRVLFTVAHRKSSGHLAMPRVVALSGMLHHAEDQVHHVLVRQGVVDMFPLPAGHHEIFFAEHPQLL